MNHDFLKRMKKIALVAIAAISGFAVTGCDDEIDKSNRFTFKGELISTYLEKNPEKFSNFVSILGKAKIGKKTSGSILKTLSTYGSYTCFAPTNEALDKFLAEEYEKYLNGEDTGITDPSIEFLSDSMATVIAKNHIIEMAYKTIDVSSGSFPGSSMSGRFTTIFPEVGDDGHTYLKLNNSARIITQDLEMENGYIQVIDGVLNPSNKLLPELIGAHKSFSLFHSAIMLTGLDSLLNIFELDPEWDGTREYNGGLASEPGSKAPYPEYNYQRYTVLVEPDELYHSLGYETLDDIIELANKWYTTTFDGKPITDDIRNDYTHRDNPLNQYVAYHIIDRQLKYRSSTSPGGFIMENYVNGGYSSLVNLNQNFDSYEYYETMMPSTIIKVTKPYTNPALKQDLVLNYSQDMGQRCMNPEMRDHMNVVVEMFETTVSKYPNLANFDQGAKNGIIHVIDKILIYNEDEMSGNILNERMRFDITALQPELSSNNLWQGSSYTYFPIEYCKGLKRYGQENLLHSRIDFGHNGDIFVFMNQYDVAIKIPPVPSKTYEIRFSTILPVAKRVRETSFVQVYFDDKICGLPICKSIISTDDRIGWVRDNETLDNGVENDKLLRNKGWMKAPDTYISLNYSTGEKAPARDDYCVMRKIILTEHIVDGGNWLRFRNIGEISDPLSIGYSEYWFDYIELVPLHIVNDPLNPEDRH